MNPIGMDLSMSRRQCVAASMLYVLSTASGALAQSIVPDISFSGFGTLGYAVLDDENAEYRTGEAQDGADKDGSFEVDSRYGLQMDAIFTPVLSATVQGIIREAEDGDPEAQLEWGFLRWLATDNLTFRLGRMSLPVYALSDFREVGHAYPWLRPPEDVYSQIPLRRFEGADVTLDTQWNQTFVRWQVFAGQARERIFENLEPDARNSLGASIVIERGPATVRLSHVRADVDVDSNNANVTQIRQGIAQAQAMVPSLAAIADDFAGVRVPLTFSGVALNLDFTRVFAEVEYTQRRVDSWVSDVDGISVAVGARFGRFRPYVHLSSLDEPEGDRRVNLPDDVGLDALEAGINGFYEPRDQQTVGLGARWDVSPQVALKAQIDHVSRDEIGISLLRLNADDGTDQGDDVTLYSIVVDFIF